MAKLWGTFRDGRWRPVWRTFDGKRYRSAFIHPAKKSLAKEGAEMLREAGLHARVVKVKGGYMLFRRGRFKSKKRRR